VNAFAGVAAVFAVGLVAVVVTYLIVTSYNAVMSLRLRIDKAWANIEVSLQQRHVPKVGFPCEVENIPEYRNGAESRIERHIACDAQDGRARRAQPQCFDEDPPSKNGASSIAGAGNQSQDGIETESNVGTGNANPGVEPVRERARRFEARR